MAKRVVKCPECGKETKTDRPRMRDKGGTYETYFCSLRCETNYRYRHNKRNIWTGEVKSPEEVVKWDKP